jgi:TatD DNase family protein
MAAAYNTRRFEDRACMCMFDAHAHLNHEQFQADRAAVWQRAQQAGVRGLVNVGFDLGSSRLAVEMAKPEAGLYAAVGVHPHAASTLSAEGLEDLRRLARSRGVVAIGETGLDFYRNLSPRQAQKDAFRRQLELAAAAGLSLIVHDRAAHEEVLEVLEAAPAGLKVILHCFSGDLDLLKEAVGRGYWIGIAGNVTYPRAGAVQAAAAAAPPDRLLLETDCPYLPPQAFRGRRNEPAYLRATVLAVAGLRGLAPAALEAATLRNACAAFGLPPTLSAESQAG